MHVRSLFLPHQALPLPWALPHVLLHFRQGKVVKAAESRKASVQPEPSFCPALCAKSLEIEESKEAQMLALQGHFSDSRLDVWQAKERLRQDKTERLKLEQEAKIMRECTFTPSKSKWHGLKAEQVDRGAATGHHMPPTHTGAGGWGGTDLGLGDKPLGCAANVCKTGWPWFGAAVGDQEAAVAKLLSPQLELEGCG